MTRSRFGPSGSPESTSAIAAPVLSALITTANTTPHGHVTRVIIYHSAEVSTITGRAGDRFSVSQQAPMRPRSHNTAKQADIRACVRDQSPKTNNIDAGELFLSSGYSATS